MNILNFIKIKLDQTKIKTKLYIFMTLPFIAIIFLGVSQINQHYDSFLQAKQGKQFVNIALILESLMVDLQKERGLSAFYISRPTPEFKEKIIKQRIKTNKHINQLNLLSQATTKDMALNNRFTDTRTMQIKFDHINKLLTKLAQVRINIDNFESQNTFSFYSRFIAKLIDLIENMKVLQNDAKQSRLTEDFINLLWLIERSGQERGALNGILATNNLTIEKLQHVLNYIDAQEKIIERFLSTADINKQKSLHIILASKEHLTLLDIRKKIQQKISRDGLISQMKSLIGFNGIIHHIKDYMVTGQKNHLDRISEKLVQLNLAISKLEYQYLINLKDAYAIQEIKNLSATFETLVLNPPLTQPAILSEEKTQQKFNNEQVAQALTHLQRGELDISDDQWWQITTKRLDNIIKINKEIELQLVDNATQLERTSLVALFTQSIFILLTLAGLCVLSYVIVQRLVGEIGNIAHFMKKMQKLHHFDQQITLTGNDEITDIERAYNELVIERKQTEHLTRISAAVFEHASEAIFITNADNVIEEVNPAFTEITGYSANDIIGQKPTLLKSGRHDEVFYRTMWESIKTTDSWQGEVWNRRKDGQIYPQYLAISAVRDHQNNVVQHIALFSDISKHKQYEEDIWHQANYDALTQLPNRNLLTNRLEHELTLMQRQNSQLAILFIDLDRFKYVNDTYGHSYGDELIVTIAEKLCQSVRKSDTIARLGGDEFIVLLPNISQLFDLEKLANKILKQASDPVVLSNNHQALVTASIGISVYPDDAKDAESLLKNADTAMYRAKELGKNRFCFYTSEMNEASSQRLRLDVEIRKAIDNQEFTLHYQPILDTKKDIIVGIEALVRWQHPSRGLIYPNEFISNAEDTGLIVPMGIQILRQAASDLSQIQQQGHNIRMAVNISGRQCTSTTNPIAEEIAKVLKEFSISSDDFHIEITESMLMENTLETQKVFNEIKALGVKIYMDDFGTGYSSLSYLKQFPIDTLKIDRSFIWSMFEDKSDEELIKAIIMIGHNLKLKLVAEGVETKAHLDYLTEAGCDYAQGYYISRPLAFDDLVQYLSTYGDTG